MNKQDPKILDLTPLYNVAEQIIQNYRDEIIAIDAIGTSTLLNSIDFDIIQVNDNTLTLQLSVAEHYIWVEYGREKTSKLQTKWEDPIGDISKWISKKIQRGKWIPKNNREIPHTQKQIRKVSYAIVQKIHEVGYYGDGDTHYGKHPLENSLKKSIADGLVDKFCNAVGGELANEIVVELKEIETRPIPKPKRPKN